MAAALGGAVDLFRRLVVATAVAPGRSIAISGIAVGHPARGRQQDGLRRFAQLGLGEQDPAGRVDKRSPSRVCRRAG
jgi:hypothetical protein